VVENTGDRLRLYCWTRERVIPRGMLGDGRLTTSLRKRWKDDPTSKYIFGSSVTSEPLNVSQVSRSFARILKVCKITKTLGTHGIRHGFISFLVNNGVSSAQIGWLVGHSSSEITKIYSHVDERTLSKVLKGLS
jgi:site-specific recombinase XerD